jgi:Protein of unknown function (DUF4231)
MSGPPAFSPDQYIETRIKQYQSWYDKKAVQSKKRYLLMRSFAVVAGGVVPVLVNVEVSVDALIHHHVMKAIVTVISLMVVIAVSLESVFHYREQWKNYRSTEQLLGRECFEFLSRVGAYKGLADDEAFRLLVERAESAISSENAATLNVMTVGSEVLADRSK